MRFPCVINVSLQIYFEIQMFVSVILLLASVFAAEILRSAFINRKHKHEYRWCCL